MVLICAASDLGRVRSVALRLRSCSRVLCQSLNQLGHEMQLVQRGSKEKPFVQAYRSLTDSQV
jgi:hypothetical protein